MLSKFLYSFSDDNPLIIYNVGEIAKDARVWSVYVIGKNGKCRKYYSNGASLGELSKMTDKQVLEMLESYYQKELEEALSVWKSDRVTANAISAGKVNLYKPSSYEIQGCLFTDETGNSVEGEILFFPVAGIGGDPYVIEYPTNTEAKYRFLDFYSTSKSDNSSRDLGFYPRYFGTGYGTVSDINLINDLYYITNDSFERGKVYNSQYFIIETKANEWTKKGGLLCFRADNPERLKIKLDKKTSTTIRFMDPTSDDMLRISNFYYNSYYSSFEKLK